MNKAILISLLLVSQILSAQLPKPNHIVIVMFQNKAYSQIVGSSNAPYINSLIADTNTALFTQSYALTHPSQPNYLMLYSGSNQGVTNDNVPTNTPFTTCNLGASLLASAFTFTGYSESMPSPGYLGNSTSLYFRKHNPWSDWQGTKSNNVPASVNQPFTSFPTNYDLLPDVCFVIPNIINCMHDGTVQQGDTWLHDNLNEYIQWAKTHNSLLILTFDEDNGSSNNRILTFFLGPMVKSGSYNTHITHYNVLRTIEDIYHLPACANSATNSAINFVWKTVTVGLNENLHSIKNITIWPVPSKEQFKINISSDVSQEGINISLMDLSGRTIKRKQINLEEGENTLNFYTNDLEAGVYLINVSGREIYFNKKITIE